MRVFMAFAALAVVLLSCGVMAAPTWQEETVALDSNNSTMLSVYWASGSTLSTAILSTNETGVWKNYTKPIDYTEGLIPILYYHNVDDFDTSDWTVKVGDFENQMKYLHENNYNTITFADMIEHMNGDKILPEKPIVISLDDGWKGQYTNAFPILKKYGFTASYYIITETALNNSYYPGYMNVSEVQEVHTAGFEIGCHSKTHPSGGLNTTSNPNLNLTLEIFESRQDLCVMLGVCPKTFAYPEGVYDQNVVNLVKQNGFIGSRAIERDGFWDNSTDARFPWIWASGNETEKFTTLSSEINKGTTQQIFEKLANYTGRNEIESMYTKVSDAGSANISFADTYAMDSFSSVSLPDMGDTVSFSIFTPIADYYDLEFRVITGYWNSTNSSEYTAESNVYGYYIDGTSYAYSIDQNYVNDTTEDGSLGISWGSHGIKSVSMSAGFHIINVGVVSNTTTNALDYLSIKYSSRTINPSDYHTSPRNLRTNIAWSTFTWKNASLASDAVVGWRVYANDTAGAWNVTDTFAFRPGYFMPPYWSGMSAQTVDLYSPSNYSNFSIVWSNGTYPIKSVYIEHNFNNTTTAEPMKNTNSEYYFNTSVLKIGTYKYRFFAVDEYNSRNYTHYYNFTIGKGQPKAILMLNGTSSNVTTTYPDNIMNITAFSSVPGLFVEFRMNWNLISNTTNETSIIMEVGAQTNAFTAQVLGDENYQTSHLEVVEWTVAKGMPDATAYIDGEHANKTIVYPSAITVSGMSAETKNPPIFNIYVNSMNKTGNPAEMTILLNSGSYNVMYGTEGNENWTSSADTSLYITVLQNQNNNVSITLNNGTSYVDQDIAITYGTEIEANCSVSYPETSRCYLFRVEPDSTVNYVGEGERLKPEAGYYTYTAVTNDTLNYAGKSVNYHVTVEQNATNEIIFSMNNVTYESGQIVNMTYGTPAEVACYSKYPEAGDCHIYRVEPDLNITHISSGETAVLGAGYYTYTAVINSTRNYAGKTADYYLMINRSVPTFRIKINENLEGDASIPYGVQANVTVYEENEGDDDCVYTLYRDGSLLNTSFNVSSTISILESLESGSYSYTYSVDDECQNWTYGYATRNLEITNFVAPVLFQFMSGGGGGGGGNYYVQSVPTPIVKVANGEANVSMSSLQSGGTLSVRIAKRDGVAIRAMNVSVVNNVSRILITISKMPLLTPTIYMEGGLVYNYIDVAMKNMTDTDIDKVWLMFAVNRSWLTDNGIGDENITIYRWQEGNWKDLEAIKTGEDKDEMLYTVRSPGFSIFAIGTRLVEEFVRSPECTESWSCTKWSECKDGYQMRTCTDVNSCGSEFKPWELKKCEFETESEPSIISGFMSLSLESKFGIGITLISIVLAMIFFRKSDKYKETKPRGVLSADD